MPSRCSSWLLLLLLITPATALESRQGCDAKQYEGKPGFTVKVGYGKTQDLAVADALKDGSRVAPLLQADFKDSSLVANGSGLSTLYVAKNTTLKTQFLRDVVIKSCLNQDVPRTDEQYIKSVVVIPDKGRIYYPLPESFTWTKIRSFEQGFGVSVIHFSLDKRTTLVFGNVVHECTTDWPDMFCIIGYKDHSGTVVDGVPGSRITYTSDGRNTISGSSLSVNGWGDFIKFKDVSVLIEAELAKREGLRKIEMGDDLPTKSPSPNPGPVQK